MIPRARAASCDARWSWASTSSTPPGTTARCVANRLIAEALHPYPRDLVIATKLGGKRLPDKSWAPALRPEELRKGAEEDLRTLRLERLDVVHLRYMLSRGRPVHGVARRADRDAGRGQDPPPGAQQRRRAARSSRRSRARRSSPCRTCSTSRAAAARSRSTPTPRSRTPKAVLDFCTRKNIAYLPFFPLAVGNVAKAEARARRDRRQAPRLARPDRACLAAGPLAHHAADPRHQLPRAPRGELGSAPDRAFTRGGGGDCGASVTQPFPCGKNESSYENSM